MDSRRLFALCVVVTTFATVSARAVNISNTWMLPEEGFPVFYRYFRDRISWYEADAVCQFHHANLVTVDSTSQYDAIRAYLKELDITNNVWIGLAKTPDKPVFSWRDFRPLSTESYWQEAIPKGNDPLCAATDPSADFRWHAMSCGGPEVASFICELPVPSWASGPGGCLLTELPSLTVLYIPEQSALELTSDCGLDGTKRIACKGNADRDEMMRQLACSISRDDFDDKGKPQATDIPVQETTPTGTELPPSAPNIKTTKPWIWTSNTIDGEDDYGSPTRHRRETVDTMSPPSTKSTTDVSAKQKNKMKQGSSQLLQTTKVEVEQNQHTAATASTPRDVFVHTVTPRNDKYPGPTATPVVDLTTQDPNSRPEEQAETFVTATVITESKAPELSSEETVEYPGAISQGQLFSIIENGTMFDIIELNGTEDNKGVKDITPGLPQNQETNSPTRKTDESPSEFLFTTVLYHKEPPGSPPLVTNTSPNKLSGTDKQELPKITDKIAFKKDYSKQKTINDLDNRQSEKTLSKEIELYPIAGGNSYTKLNRTNRKELPLMYDDINAHEKINLDVDNNLPAQSEHHMVEIKLHNGENNQIKETTFFVTTKRNIATNSKSLPTTVPSESHIDKKTVTTEANIKTNPITTPKTITKKIDLNVNKNIEGSGEELKNNMNPFDEVSSEEIMKHQYNPNLSSLEKTVDKVETTQETTEPEPEQQPRPNRQRQLTRTQRRSFYPYFFSRVLG